MWSGTLRMLLMPFSTCICVLQCSKPKYSYASQELHHGKQTARTWLITGRYLFSDRLSRNELRFNGNEQCYIGALAQIAHRIVTSLHSQVLLFAVAKQHWRNIHLERTIDLQHTVAHTYQLSMRKRTTNETILRKSKTSFSDTFGIGIQVFYSLAFCIILSSRTVIQEYVTRTYYLWGTHETFHCQRY